MVCVVTTFSANVRLVCLRFLKHNSLCEMCHAEKSREINLCGKITSFSIPPD